MSKSGLLPGFLHKVHQKFHTPYSAILIIFPFVLGLGLTGSMSNLASSTSAMVLVVFTLSSTALVNIKIKQGKKGVGREVFCIPLFIPCLAIILNLIAIAFLPLQDIIPAAVFIGLGSIITWLVMKSLNVLK